MTKRKGHFEHQANFLTALPIEECCARLDALNSETDILLRLYPLNSDKVDFVAEVYEKGRLRVIGKGALRRWEGTLTRVDCRLEVRDGLLNWSIALLVLLALPLLIIPLLFFYAAQLNPTWWFVVVSLMMMVVLASMAWVNHLAPPNDTPQNLLARIADILSPIL